MSTKLCTVHNTSRKQKRKGQTRCSLFVLFTINSVNTSVSFCADMSNLEELKAKADTLAQKVIDLKKADPVDKDAIGATVKELLEAKRTYAQNNNGIGVDGKPWEEPLSKAEKKKRDKAKKAAGGCGNAVNDDEKQVSSFSKFSSP